MTTSERPFAPPGRRERLLEQQTALAALTRMDGHQGGSLKERLQFVTETAARLMGVERVGLWRYTETRSAIRCLDLYESRHNRHTDGVEIRVEDYPAYFQALVTSEVIVVDDSHADPRIQEFFKTYLMPLGVTAMLDVPIHLHGRVDGVLRLAQLGPRTPWTPEDRLFGIALANLIALAVERDERIRAEEALRESEQRLATLVAYAPDAILVFDVDADRYIQVNKQAALLFGYDCESLLQIDPTRLSPERQPDGRLSSVARREYLDVALQGGTPVFEWTHQNVRGELIPCEIRLVRLPHTSCRLVRGSIIDIGERKRTEQALRSSEQRLSTMLAYSPDAITLLDVDTLRFVQANEQAARLYGYDRTTLLRLGPVELSPKCQPDGRPSAVAAREKVLEALDGGVPVFEWTHLNAAGALFPCEVRLVRLPDASRRLVRGSIIDISERKRAEAALRESEARMRGILDASMDCIISIDHAGRIIEFNPASERTFGYQREGVIGRELAELIIPPSLRDAHRRGLAKYLATGEGPLLGRRIEVQALRSDGTEFPVEISLTPILGDPKLVTATVRDITARERTQAELHEAKEAAEKASRAKSEFLASMSHELRTPLNSVLGYAQLLRCEEELSQRQRKALNVIQQAGEHLQRLIEEILDMAKIEAGTLDIVTENVDLHRMLDGIVEITRSRAQSKGLAFTFAPGADVPAVVSADERRLCQVLTNLLDNAIKYTRHGEVVLRTSMHERSVCFAVEDTGLGIRAEHLSEIFDVFHQVRDPSMIVEGTGLGLAISKRLVHLMGGELQVASKPHEGSRFWFELELRPVSAPAPVATNWPATGVAGARRRVLVVDDDQDGRGLLSDLLIPLGFEVHEAADGLEAVHEAARLKPDAILMDMRMPRLDGLAATAQIRTMPDLAGTVIFAISASAFEHNRARCIESGANEFIPKPFRQEKLLELLCEHLGLTLLRAPPKDPNSERERLAPLIAPPCGRLLTFIDFASRGDVRQLLIEANALANEDPIYAPFTERIIAMGDAYQMKELRRWLKSFAGTP
ncbi:PAS domain S-box protein [Paraburkholderia sp. BR13439]|uniref:PAS domain S-box protein n=1 Tax=Paraburkholderia TaxID=1822464 RepID=UPI0034CE258B